MNAVTVHLSPACGVAVWVLGVGGGGGGGGWRAVKRRISRRYLSAIIQPRDSQSHSQPGQLRAVKNLPRASGRYDIGTGHQASVRMEPRPEVPAPATAILLAELTSSA